ncbi:hypothetical protein EXIGLDRAFT_769081 [Exidia glandulosa HHB12029]|uniref:F-box domain-containing protein n=1 Tax=Exidia glandulosa HHB12029 TaxID=1314781 RepID=A0A165HQG4_EXIGL|nr:hypothetical protein EXIGLDRAFT_769081 [Exidia glandulosa HHB12029]
MASMLNVKLRCLSGLTYLSVSPALDIFTWAFDDVTMPALLELHLATWFKLDRGFLARHPRLKRLSLGEYGGSRPFLDPIPSGLEYLRISHATHALDLLKRLPQGKDANMTRLDLGVSSAHDGDERLEILTLLRDRYPTLSQVNIFGRFARDVLENPHAPPIDHVTRAGAVYSRPILHYTAHEISVLLVRLAHLFPNLRTLDFIDSGIHGSAFSPASQPDMVRLVQSTAGLQQVEVINFPDGDVYARSGFGSFELLATRASTVRSSSILELMGVSKLPPLPQSNWTKHVYDYPRILWPDL